MESIWSWAQIEDHEVVSTELDREEAVYEPFADRYDGLARALRQIVEADADGLVVERIEDLGDVNRQEFVRALLRGSVDRFCPVLVTDGPNPLGGMEIDPEVDPARLAVRSVLEGFMGFQVGLGRSGFNAESYRFWRLGGET